MTGDDTKQLALSWFEAAVSGDAERWLDMMHDDFRFYAPANMPLSGWSDRAGFLATTELLNRFVTGPATYKVGAIVAEGDRVMWEGESDIGLTDGGRYNNYYMVVIQVRDGKILEYKEFFDSLYLFQTLDAPEVRGELKPRESHITEVTTTMTGSIADVG
jgi:uncharacterized protein